MTTSARRRSLLRTDWSAASMGPRRMPTEAKPEQLRAPPPPRPPVLVIESDRLLRDVVSTALESEGHEVRSVESVAEGLTSLRADPPGAVIAGVHLGGQRSIVSVIRGELGEGVPILVISGQKQAEQAIEALEHGADDYITTPFSPRELVARLHRRLTPASDRWATDVVARFVRQREGSGD